MTWRLLDRSGDVHLKALAPAPFREFAHARVNCRWLTSKCRISAHVVGATDTLTPFGLAAKMTFLPR